MADIVEVNRENWRQEVKESRIPVIVDFYANWCHQCPELYRTLQQFAGEYEGRIKFVKVNVEEDMEFASEKGAKSLPTLVLMNHGEVADIITGNVARDVLKSRLEECIGADSKAEKSASD